MFAYSLGISMTSASKGCCRATQAARLCAVGAFALAMLWTVQVPAAAATGCAAGSTCKSISVDSANAITNPTSGVISLVNLTANRKYTMVDALQVLAAGGVGPDLFYQGTYAMSWSSCAIGSATGATYDVGPNAPTTSFSLGVPPTTTGTLPTITTSASGQFSCGYSLSFTVGALSSTTGLSARNDVFVLAGTAPAAQVASLLAGLPPLGPAPTIPEAPLSLLLAVSALAVFATAFLWDSRRRLDFHAAGQGYQQKRHWSS